MTDHAEHFAGQQILWDRINKALTREQEREPHFCRKCALTAIYISQMIALDWAIEREVDEAITVELRQQVNEIQMAYMTYQNGGTPKA